MRAAGKPGTGAKVGKAPANKSRTGAPKKPKVGLMKTKNIKKGLKMIKKGQKPAPKKVDTKKAAGAVPSPSPSKSKKADGKVKDELPDQSKVVDGSPSPKGRSSASVPRRSPKKSRDQSPGGSVSAKAGKVANAKTAGTKTSPKKQKPASNIASKTTSVPAKAKSPKDNSKKPTTEKGQKTNSDASLESSKTLPPKKRKTVLCEAATVGKESTVVGKESTVVGKESAVVGKESAVVGMESAVVGKESAVVGKESAVVGKESAAVGKESATTVSKDLPAASKDSLASLGKLLLPLKPELMDTGASESPSSPGPKKAAKKKGGDSSINPKKRGRPKGSKNKLKLPDDKNVLKCNPTKDKVGNDKKVKQNAKQKTKVIKSVPKVKDKSYIDESSIIPESETKVKRLAAILSSEVDHYTYNTDDGSSEYEEYAYSRKSIKKKTTSKVDSPIETKVEKSGGKSGKAEKFEVTASSGWETSSDADNTVDKKIPNKNSRDSEENSNVRNAIDSVLSKMKVEHEYRPSEMETSATLPKTSTPKNSTSQRLTPVKTSRSNVVKKNKEDSCADDEESDYDSGFSLKKERSATMKKSESTFIKSGQGKRKLPQKGASTVRSKSGKAVSFASDEEEESHKESESEEESTTEKKKRLKSVSKSKSARGQQRKAVVRSPSPLRRTARMASLNARAVMHCMNEDARMPFHSPRAEAKKTPPPPAQDMALVLRAESTIAKRHTDDDSDDESEEESVHIRRFSGKRKKDASGSSGVGGKLKKVRKKRRGELDIQMDMRDMVVTKRMASLNASAIMAASYCVESRRRTPCHAASSSAESEITNLNIKRKISYKSTKSKDSKSRSVITVQETTKKLKKAEGTRETEVEERIIVKKKVKRHSSGRSNTHDDTDKDDDDDIATDASEINHDEIIPKSPEDGGMIVESTITYITTQTDTSPQTVSLSGGVSSYSISSGDRKTTTVVQQVERKSKTTTKCTAYSTGAPPTAFIPPTHYVQPVLHSSPPLMGSGSLKPPVSYSPLGALSGMQPTSADSRQPSPPTTSSPALINTNRQLQPSFPGHHQHHYHHHIHAPTIHHHHHPPASPSNPPQPPSNALGGGYHHQQPPPNYHHQQQPQQQQNHRPSPPSPVGTPQHQQQYLQPHSPPYPPPPLPSPASGRPPPMLMAGGPVSGGGYQLPPLQHQDQQHMQQQQLSPQKLLQHPYHYSHLQQQHPQQNFIPNSQQQHQMLHHHQQQQLQQHPMLTAAPPSLKQQQQQKQLGNARPAVSSPCSVSGAMSTASSSSSSMTNSSMINAQQQQHYMQQQHQLHAQNQQQLIHPMRQQKQQQQQLSYSSNQVDSTAIQQVPHGGGPLMGPDSNHPSQGPGSYHHRQATANYHSNNTQAQNHCVGGATPNNQMVISNSNIPTSNSNSFNQMGGNSSNSASVHCSNLLSNSTPSPGGGGNATNSNSSSPLPRSSPLMLRGPQESPKALLPPPPGPDCSVSERHQSAFTAPAVSAVTGPGFCCGSTTAAPKRPHEAFTDLGPFNNSQQSNKQIQKKLQQNDQHFQRNCSSQQQQQQQQHQIQQQNAQKQMQLMQYQQQQQQQIKYQQLMKQQQQHMQQQQQQEQNQQKHPPPLSSTKRQSNSAPFMASKTKEVISLDRARSPSIPPSPGPQQSPAVARPQQQSPDSSGRVISCSNSSSSSSSSISPGARGEVSSVGTTAWSQQNGKRRSNSVTLASSSGGTEPLDGVSSDSSIAATIANLLKLNSCTITSAAAPASTPRRDVPSPTSSAPFASTSSGDKPATGGVPSKASPQVPSINSTTTNVPVSPDKKISSTNKLSNNNSTSNNFCNNTSSRNNNDSCNSINNITGGTIPLVQNRNKSLVGSSSSLTQNFNSSVSVKSKVTSESSKAGNSRSSPVPARTNNLKNTEDIRRSIASALPHLSASMVLKEVEAPPRQATDVPRDAEKDQQTHSDVSFNSSATPVNSTSSQPMEFEEDSLTICLPSSGSILTSSSPCLGFATNDANDLSVANDLLLLSQSDLQFPLQTLNMGGLSATVSSTSSGGESEVSLLPVCAVGEDHQVLRPPSPSKGSHSSSATSSSVDRSNSNSPNSRFGSRHLLCQIVPAHSQSKTATARAKPQGLTGQKSSVKAEIKESSPGPALNILSSSERNPSQDSSIRDRKSDNKESSGHPNHKLDNAIGSTGRKRGRPPKAKEKSSPGSASSSPVLSNDLTVRAESKNGRGIGETVTPSPTHQYKLKNNEEKPMSSKKLGLSSQADLKDSKLSFSCLDTKKSLLVKTESVPKIKSEKASPSSAYSVDSQTKVSSTSFKLVNGDAENSANSLSYPDDVDKLADALSCHKLSHTKSQIPTSEELKYVLTEHSKQEGNKLKPGTSKKSGDDSEASKSDSSSSREGSNPPNKCTKSPKQAQKGSSSKPLKTGKNIAAKKTSESSKWRCKKSLLAYLKEKNENDTSNVDSDVPSGSVLDALPGASSAGAEGGDPLRPGGENTTKAVGPGAFPSYPLKALRRRTSSGSSKGKAVKKPKWIHGWSWEGEPYQGKIWLRNDEAVVGRTCYHAMQHREGDLVRVRDCVLLRSGPRKVDLPFVAKVAALWEDPDSGDMMMSILWYYRPEHTEFGRQEHDLVDEIFASKHRDHLSVACIEDTCYVLTFNEYCRYRRQLRQTLQGLPPQQVVSVVPDAEAEYPRQQRQPPGCVVPDLLFFCRRVYDYRQKRLLKNPC